MIAFLKVGGTLASGLACLASVGGDYQAAAMLFIISYSLNSDAAIREMLEALRLFNDE